MSAFAYIYAMSEYCYISTVYVAKCIFFITFGTVCKEFDTLCK